MKLAHREVGDVQIIDVRDGIYWNGARITPAQFDAYLLRAKVTKPWPLFHVKWRKDQRDSAAVLVKKMRADNFEVAVNCPPTPF